MQYLVVQARAAYLEGGHQVGLEASALLGNVQTINAQVCLHV